jgi:hypothetical protein
MEGPIQKHQGEIFSLNIDDLDVGELERRLEMAVALTQIDACVANKSCNCGALSSCGQYCN